MKRSRNHLHLGDSPSPASAKNSDCVDAGGIFPCGMSQTNFPQRGTESVMSLDDDANMPANSHTTHSNQMMLGNEDDRGASHAVAVSDILSLDPTDIDTGGSVRQVSFDRRRLPPAVSSMSGMGLTPSTSVGSYSGTRSMSGSSAAGCCMTDVTSSFLSMSPCSAATDASGIPGWSPVSVTSTSTSTSMQLPSQQIDNTNTTDRSTAASSWRDNGDNVNNNNKRSSSVSDSCGRTTFGRIRSNRKKRSLHRQPPSKCLSSLAAEVSILESDGDDNCCNDSGSDSDEDSFPSNTGSTWDKPNRTSSTDPFSSNYCYDGRSSFNTRPYKRQPSSCEWDPHGSSSISGSHRAPTSSRCSSSNVSGADAGSVSPCFSHASSNGDQQNGAAMSPLLLSQSAPSGLVGEWGQFVDVISADERNGGIKKKERPQPLAFSPGLGGLRCIPGRTGDSAASSSSTTRVDTSTNLPYFPKSRRRGSSGRVTLRRRASSVGSHHDMTPTGGTGSSNRRRFAITARFAGGTRSAVARAHSSSLFLQDTSIQGKTSGGPSPPPPSPSLGPTSVRQSSGKSTISEQPLTPRPSLDDVSFAMDNMQV